jgi:hypothetical protein
MRPASRGALRQPPGAARASHLPSGYPQQAAEARKTWSPEACITRNGREWFSSGRVFFCYFLPGRSKLRHIRAVFASLARPVFGAADKRWIYRPLSRVTARQARRHWPASPFGTCGLSTHIFPFCRHLPELLRRTISIASSVLRPSPSPPLSLVSFLMSVRVQGAPPEAA